MGFKKYFSNFKFLYSFIFIITIFIILVFSIYCTILSFKFNVPISILGKQETKKCLVYAIDKLTHIYDPSTTLIPVFQPEKSKNKFDEKNYIRLENIYPYNGKRSLTLINILKVINPKIIESKIQFGYQPFEDKRLKEIREQFHLDDVVSSAKDELSTMIMLRNWTRSQFRRNDYQDIMKNFDALYILNNKKLNVSNVPHRSHQYRPCNFFPLLYSQVLLSMGYTPRLVNISHKLYDDGHGLVEVWSNQFEKWITMDADLNLHYEKNRIPQNLLEVHNERYEKDKSSLKIMYGHQESGDAENNKRHELENMINYHSYFHVVSTRNDWLTNYYFKGHPVRANKLYYVDKLMPDGFIPYSKTSKTEEFYWTLNQTEMLIREGEISIKSIPLVFKTFTPNFKHFEIVVDGMKKVIIKDCNYLWQLHLGKNSIKITSVNKFMVYGVPSYAELFVNKKEL